MPLIPPSLLGLRSAACSDLKYLIVSYHQMMICCYSVILLLLLEMDTNIYTITNMIHNKIHNIMHNMMWNGCRVGLVVVGGTEWCGMMW